MDNQRTEEIASDRLQMIASLLDPGIDDAKRQQLKQEICIRTGLSERTIRRYYNSYKAEGFAGLKPKISGQSGKSVIPDDILEEAIALRREVPKRSVKDIIQILEWEGKVRTGEIKRSTLQDQLTLHGFSSSQMRIYAENSVSSARRYQKPWRNYLWQADIKYGLYVNGQPTYMVCFLDDCTRNIMHSEFYDTLDQDIVRDCFRKALIEYGLPDAVVFDNGKQFRTRWMKRACSKLGIRLIYCRPYNPEGKGKQERFNETVDKFLREASLKKIRDLEELNRLYHVWLDECYLNIPHSALPDGQTPVSAYNSDSHGIRLADADTIAEAFLSCEKRRVDKCGCISFSGEKYEVENGLNLIHRDVEVVYAPADISELTIECEGFASCKAVPLVIAKNSAAKPKLPESYEKTEASTSRLLDAAEKKNAERRKRWHGAISFSSISDSSETPSKGGDR